MFSVVAEPITVKTKAGVLIGETDGKISVFKGVPYAQPPVGALRWRPPQPMKWEGERQATAFGCPCLQTTNPDGKPNFGGVVGETCEDCLFLNIWAPATADNAPIMLWLFGGGGVMGSGNVPTYHGDAFARDGVILVTINYRLGALGGFAHPALTREVKEGEGFGNYHLLDAMAALRWIKDNARVFGGDPDNVTVFGESAGATMTANLLTAPMAKGLFDKAIIESTGSLPTPGTPLEEAEKRGVAAMKELGLPEDASAADMRNLPARDIMGNRKVFFGLRTILDGRLKTQSIMDAFASGNHIDVPLMIGTNSDEGRLMGTQKVAAYAQTNAPVWQYFFDYVPEYLRDRHPNGAPHAGEIAFVFDTLTKGPGADQITDKDKAVARQVHACWVAFAKAPLSTRTLACADGFKWPARSEENGRTVAIFKEFPSLGHADDLKSPPNGAKPGPTSRP
jgi:para-nitrobenzyl esterase